MMRELGLHTVCEEARCPNIGECWEHKAATFMILGDVCTRNCAYCAVSHGTPTAFDPLEPVRLAEAVERMGLAARGDHLGRPRRPAQRRRRGLRRLHHRDQAPAARDVGRSADPRLQGIGARAPDRDGRPARHPQPQPRDRRAAVPPGPARAGGTTARCACWPTRGAWIPARSPSRGIILGMGEEWDEVLRVHARPSPERRQHPDPRPVSAAVGRPPAGGPLLHAGRVRRAARHRARDGLHARAVEPAHPVVVPRVGAGRAAAAAAVLPSCARNGRRPDRSPRRARGRARPRSGPAPTSTARWLRQMLLIRRFEEKAGEAYSLGKIGGFCHLYIGQEAVAVGSLAALRPGRLHHLLLPRARPRAGARHHARARSWRSCSARRRAAPAARAARCTSSTPRSVPRRARHRRRAHPAHHRHGLRHQVPRHRPGGGLLLRRGGGEQRRVPRGAQHGRALEAARRSTSARTTATAWARRSSAPAPSTTSPSGPARTTWPTRWSTARTCS